jgi:UDP-GlcNAc:undecaprenyl-phosphate GlcNAc-1-phosphate transferase
MLAFLTAFLFAMITLPVVIRISHSWGLVDAPSGGRKLHSAPVPFVGGLVIFAGTLIVTGLFANPNPAELMPLLKLAAVATVLLLTGLFDDMEGLSPGKKLLVHFAVGIVLILGADLRIEGFGGLFGVGLLPYAVSAFFSLFVYGLLVCGGFGSWFLVTGQPGFAVLAFALAGTLAGFTIFNTSPARIFMGDNGSLVLGVCIFAFSMKMMGTHSGAIPAAMQGFSLPVLAMTFLAYPLVDTLRVFAIRILRGKSPLSADRNHLHHRLLGLGFGHKGTALTVHLYTIAMISLFFWLPQGTAAMAFAGQFGCAIILPATINIAIRLKTAKGRRTAQSNS